KHLIAFLKAMEFNTLTRRIAEKAGLDAGQIDANAALMSGTSQRAEPEGELSKSTALARPATPATAPSRLPLLGGGMNFRESRGRKKADTNDALTPQAFAAANVEAVRALKFDRSKYETVRTLDRLNAWIARAHDTGVVAIDTQTTSPDPMQANLCGFSL